MPRRLFVVCGQGDNVPVIRHLVFDVGRVLFDWDMRYLFRTLIDDPARLDWFVTHVVTPEWHFQVDEGRDVAAIVAERIAEFPDEAPLIRAYADRFVETIPGMMPGMEALMADIIARGVPLFAITNFGAQFWRQFRAGQPLFDHFTDIIVSGEEKIAKPDPAIFTLAIERFGIDPAAALFIDDRADNVAAAIGAGFQGHHFIDADTLRSHLNANGVL